MPVWIAVSIYVKTNKENKYNQSITDTHISLSTVARTSGSLFIYIYCDCTRRKRKAQVYHRDPRYSFTYDFFFVAATVRLLFFFLFAMLAKKLNISCDFLSKKKKKTTGVDD